MKTVVKILVLVGILLGCYVAFAAAVWGMEKLLNLMQVGNDDLYIIAAYAALFGASGFIAFGYSLLVRTVLINRPKRVLIALANGIVITAVSVGAILLFRETLGQYVVLAPGACVLSIIISVVMLALSPKSLPLAEDLPQVETVPEAAQEA